MAAIGAFARSRALMKAKDVPLAMTKWWGKMRPTDAEITRHLAANEQHIIVPWLKTFPKKVVDRFTTYLWPTGTILLIVGSIVRADSKNAAEEYEHRF